MRSEDLFKAMNGIDDKIVADTYNYSTKIKVVRASKNLPFAAFIGIALFATVTATAVAAIHHFWGRGMTGMVSSTDVQQQTLTEQGQAIVYSEEPDYSTYAVTDQGITIVPDTIIADAHYAYVSFKVSGLNVEGLEEPGAETTYYLGDDPDSIHSWLNGSGSFFDGIVPNEDGMGEYEDGTPLQTTENGELITHYVDENGDLQYNLIISAADMSDSLLGQTLHMEFTQLGIYTDKCELTPTASGSWSFDLELPQVSNAKVITVNKQVPGTDCTIDTIEITPISIVVNYKVNGKLEEYEDCNGIPEFMGVGLTDGTNYKYISNGGSSYYTDDSMEKAVSSACFQRIIDVSEVRSLYIRTSDYEDAEIVEVVLPE